MGMTTYAIHVPLRQRGWSGRMRHVTGWFLSIQLFLLYSLAHASPHQWTYFDNLFIIRHVSVQGNAFLGVELILHLILGGLITQKTYIEGVSRLFQV